MALIDILPTDEIFQQTIEHAPDLADASTPHAIGVTCIALEEADGGRGVKGVFVGTREAAGKMLEATFEVGSFLDKGGVEDAPEKHDVCISTAGGCTRACTFCSVPVAELGFERLLTPEEIVFQAAYMIALRNPDERLPNVLGLMGNGEPVDNKAIIPAIEHLAPRSDVQSITVSTIGENLKGIRRLEEAVVDLSQTVKLQLSLHAADEDKRRQLIPGRASLGSVMEAADHYAEATSLPVKFNVVLMDGTENTDQAGFSNATPEDAVQLAQLLQLPSFASGAPIHRRLKLSAYNPVVGTPFTAPEQDKIDAFVATLHEEGIGEIKTFRGSGINVDVEKGTGGFACGQLRATTNLARKRYLGEPA